MNKAVSIQKVNYTKFEKQIFHKNEVGELFYKGKLILFYLFIYLFLRI